MFHRPVPPPAIRRPASFLLVFLLLALSAALVPAATEPGPRTLTLNYAFPAATFTPAADGYVRVSVEGLVSVARPGQPELPAAVARVLLPEGMEVESVKASAVETEVLEPGGRPDYNRGVDSTDGLAAPLRAEPDPAVYGEGGPFPGRLAEYKTTGTLHGCRIALVRLNPLTYFPRLARLQFARRVTLQVVLRPAGPAARAARPARRTEAAVEEVRQAVDNPAALADRTDVRAGRFAEPWDYLIVTHPSFLAAFQELADHKAGRGLAVHVASIGDVLAQYAGRDDAEKLRAFLSQAYEEHGVRWVVLGGDTAYVPHRGCYGNLLNSIVDQTMPTDLYFAALDGDWDANRNNVFGELADEVDFFPEVHVGRISASTANQATTQIRKIIAYENSAPPFSALLLGESLDSYTLGDDAVEKGWQMMAGIPATRLYDGQGGWIGDDLVNLFNTTEVHLVNHAGHSNACFNMRLKCTDLPRLTNTAPFFVITTGCYPGAFDEGCFAERLTVGTSAGAFATVMNSRYGWYHPWSDNGSSDMLNRSFLEQVFQRGHRRLGEALDAAKTTYAAYLDDGSYRWSYYVLNLFGCPETELHWAQPNPAPRMSFVQPQEGFRANQHDDLAVAVSLYDNDGHPLAGAAVGGEALAGETIAHFPLNDEGRWPDRAAGDGIYTGPYTPRPAGPLTLRVTAAVEGAEPLQQSVTGTVLPYAVYRLDQAPTAWIDPAGGQVISAGWDYDGHQVVDIGFPFTFYGQTAGSVLVTENGCLHFNDAYVGDSDPLPIPSALEPNGVLAAYWTDLCVKNGGSLACLQTGAAPHRRFVVTWQDIPHYEQVGAATFQVALEETTNRILVNYRDTVFGNDYCDSGHDAVAGLEDFGGGKGLVFSFHEPRLVNGLSLVYQPLPAGDVNADGVADDTDAQVVADVLAGNLAAGEPPCRYPLLADFDASGDVDVLDWLTLRGLLSGR